MLKQVKSMMYFSRHNSVLKCSNIKEYQHALHGDALKLTLINFTQFYASANASFLLFLIQVLYILLYILVGSMFCQL